MSRLFDQKATYSMLISVSISKKALKKRIYVLFGTLLYVFFLHYVYLAIVAQTFFYMGYSKQASSEILVWTALIMASIPGLWMPVELTRYSHVIYWLMYVLVVIPGTIVPVYTASVSSENILLLQISLFISNMLLMLSYKLPLLRLPLFRVQKFLLWFGIVAISIVFYIIIVKSFGFRATPVSIVQETYDVRDTFKFQRGQSSRIAAYCFQWQGQAFNIFFLAMGLARKNLFLIGIGTFLQVVLYNLSGHKSLLFSPVFWL